MNLSPRLNASICYVMLVGAGIVVGISHFSHFQHVNDNSTHAAVRHARDSTLWEWLRAVSLWSESHMGQLKVSCIV